MSRHALPRGVYAPLLTFYDDRERVDLDAVAAHARALLDEGLAGLVIAGSTGEFHLLTAEERRAIVESVAAACPGAVLFVHAGAPSTRETCALAEHAAAAGAAAVMAVTPYYNRVDDAGKADHLRAVAAAAGHVPVVAYSMPAMAGDVYGVDLLLRLFDEGVVAGSKESAPDLDRVQALYAGAGDAFAIFPGNAPLHAAAVLAGAHGAILALANIAPARCVAVDEAAAAGDAARAHELARTLRPLVAALAAAGPAPTGLRAAVALRYNRSEATRAPLQPVSSDGRGRIAAVLEEAVTATRC